MGPVDRDEDEGEGLGPVLLPLPCFCVASVQNLNIDYRENIFVKVSKENIFYSMVCLLDLSVLSL
jgi:hypothetical protein